MQKTGIERAMRHLGWWLLALLLLAAGGPVHGAATAQDSAFDIAARFFQDGSWDRAEKGFDGFIQKFPRSPKRMEAILYQAQARFKLQNYNGTLELLTPNVELAGRLADQYRYWMAEALFQKGDYQASASGYAQLIKDFPKSTNLLAAAYGEALSRFRRTERPEVIKLLSLPDSVFRMEAGLHPKDELVVRGDLLLTEALLDEKQYRPAETALVNVSTILVNPELSWRRQYLDCRILRGANRLDDALAGATNLIQLAGVAKQPALQAMSLGMEAEILEQMKRLPEAAQVYEKNLGTNAPQEYRRQALLKIIDLNLAQNDVTNTIQKLELFSTQYPKDAALDVAQLTLGELRLRQFYDAAGGSITNDEAVITGAQTNLLEQAITNFNAVITGFGQGPQAGKAHLSRGWCFWHLGRRVESLPDFFQATQRLPVSEEQAIARYKLGEVQFLQRDYTNALVNFQLVVSNYTALPRVRSTLFDQALYKIVRGAVEIGDLPVAGAAARKILDWFPESFFSDRSLLVYGQALNHQGSPAEARAEFTAFLNKFPQDPLAPELQLAVARTYIQENNWKAAAQQYGDWITRYPTNNGLAQAEYDRALATWKSGDDTNAVEMMTKLVSKFPNDPNAPLAQRSIADFFFNQGQYTKAEANYQLLFQNTNAPLDLAFQARLWAGRAASARLGFADARRYFIDMINAPQCPTNMLVEAWFLLGDTWIEDLSSDPTKPVAKFGDANLAFGKITQNYPNTRLAALAWGKIGGGHLQLAKQEAERYEFAAQAFTASLTHPEADAYVRGLAEIGLGTVFERQGKLPLAVEHYENVVYYDESKLRPGERPDPAHIKEAGLAAARLLEDQQQWGRAVKMYQRLQEILPNLKPELQQRVERAKQRIVVPGC